MTGFHDADSFRDRRISDLERRVVRLERALSIEERRRSSAEGRVGNPATDAQITPSKDHPHD